MRSSVVVTGVITSPGETAVAMTLTLAEALFEHVLRSHGIEHERVPVATDVRTPDYLVRTGGVEIAVEVKQIEKNAEEQAADRALESGQFVVTGGTPGDRVRRLIADARGQLAPHAESGRPTMLVAYDSSMRLHADSYNVLVAMYGLQTIVLSVPQPHGDISVKGQKFGPKRKMTPDMNTSISSIGVIRTSARDVVTFEVFHNYYARVPLDASVWASYGIEQYALRGNPGDGFQDWTRAS